MIPDKYKFLLKEPGPKMLIEALRLYGTLETKGEGDNPVILAWAAETGLSKIYKRDATAWCGLFMALVAQRAGKQVPKDPLWALNWKNFGTKALMPSLGDVVVGTRPTGGHVGIYVGEDKTHYHLLAGNQSDQVNIMRFEKSRVVAVRRPIYNIEPENVRPIKMDADGAVSINEA